jgi:hypothetical protein
VNFDDPSSFTGVLVDRSLIAFTLNDSMYNIFLWKRM